MAKRDIYIAIMVAAAQGRSLHLRVDELDALSLDDAISTAALNTLSQTEYDAMLEGKLRWSDIKPTKKREVGNGYANSGGPEP